MHVSVFQGCEQLRYRCAVLDESQQHTMSLFTQCKPCLRDPTTDTIIKPYVSLDAEVAGDGPINNGLESEYELLARLHERHNAISFVYSEFSHVHSMQ